MLLFIGKTGDAFCDVQTFQYITCYSLSKSTVQNEKQTPVSIHHMLLFIQKEREIREDKEEVSIHHMLLFIGQGDCSPLVCCCFNTSHVTLYLGFTKVEEDKYGWFQYITCYSLSVRTDNKQRYSFKFQYITCYSLSICRFSMGNSSYVSIHHMLLFIRIRSSINRIGGSFNTSHVTLYLIS